MGKDLSDHRGFLDGGDDFQLTPTMRTAFDVDIEHPFQQASPADADSRRLVRRLTLFICRVIGVDCFVWDDFGTVFGVGREYAMTNPSGTDLDRASDPKGEIQGSISSMRIRLSLGRGAKAAKRCMNYSEHPALRPSGQPSVVQNRSRQFCQAAT